MDVWETVRVLRRQAWVRLAMVAACGLLVYLTGRDSGRAADFAFLPGWLVDWADSHDQAPHFFAFFLVCLPAFAFRFPERDVLRIAGAETEPRSRYQLFSAFFFAFLAVLLEFVQRLIPTRSFNPDDLAANLLGVTAAWCVWKIIHR